MKIIKEVKMFLELEPNDEKELVEKIAKKISEEFPDILAKCKENLEMTPEERTVLVNKITGCLEFFFAKRGKGINNNRGCMIAGGMIEEIYERLKRY